MRQLGVLCLTERVSLLTVIEKKGWKIAFWSKEQWYCSCSQVPNRRPLRKGLFWKGILDLSLSVDVLIMELKCLVKSWSEIILFIYLFYFQPCLSLNSLPWVVKSFGQKLPPKCGCPVVLGLHYSGKFRAPCSSWGRHGSEPGAGVGKLLGVQEGLSLLSSLSAGFFPK